MDRRKNAFIIVMYCRIRKTQYGKWRNKKYREVKSTYLRGLAYQRKWVHKCPDCGARLNYRNRTIDHIIPLWVCRDYRMPNLEFDVRNFRIMCQACNTKRSHVELTIETLQLPAKVKERLMKIEPIATVTDVSVYRMRADRAVVIH